MQMKRVIHAYPRKSRNGCKHQNFKVANSKPHHYFTDMKTFLVCECFFFLRSLMFPFQGVTDGKFAVIMQVNFGLNSLLSTSLFFSRHDLRTFENWLRFSNFNQFHPPQSVATDGSK